MHKLMTVLFGVFLVAATSAPSRGADGEANGISGKWVGAGHNSKGQYSAEGALIVTEHKDGTVTGEWGAPLHLTIEKGERVAADVLQWESSDNKGRYRARCTQKGKSLVIDWTYTYKDNDKVMGETGTIILVRQ
jgi:hypothetical protein